MLRSTGRIQKLDDVANLTMDKDISVRLRPETGCLADELDPVR